MRWTALREIGEAFSGILLQRRERKKWASFRSWNADMEGQREAKMREGKTLVG